MSTLWIREYTKVGYAPSSGHGSAPIPIPDESNATDQTPLTFSTSAQSAAFAATTNFIAIIGSTAFHYVVGSDPTATTGKLKVPADTLLFLRVNPGQKLAAINAA